MTVLEGDETTWALLLFKTTTPASFVFEFTEARETNSTILRGSHGSYNLGGVTPLPETHRRLGAAAGALEFGSNWGSLVIEAASISIASPGAGTVLAAAEPGESFVQHLPGVDYPVQAVYPGTWPPPSWLTIKEPGQSLGTESLTPAPLEFELHATGVKRMGWHNVTVNCGRTSPCPDAGRPWSYLAPGPQDVRLERLSYIGIETENATLRGSGHAFAWAAGAAAMELGVNGTTRLPAAHLEGTCRDGTCPNPSGGTLLGSGNVRLADLHRLDQRSGRLRGHMEATFSNAAIDESPVPSLTSNEAAIAVFAAAAGLAVLGKLLLGLFACSSRPPALDHPRRRELHALVVNEPGLSFRAIQRRLGWHVGTLNFHLGRLQDEGRIKAERYYNTVRYFENHGKYAKTWRELTALQDPEAQRLHAWILAHPGQDQTRLAHASAGWGWNRSRLRRRLANLVDSGLVSSHAKGRRTEYTATAARPSPVPASDLKHGN